MRTCPVLWSFRFYPQFTSERTWPSGTQGKSGLYLDLEVLPTGVTPGKILGVSSMGCWAAVTRTGFALKEGAFEKEQWCPQIRQTARVGSLKGAEASRWFIPQGLLCHHVGTDLYATSLETQRLEKQMTSIHSVKTQEGARPQVWNFCTSNLYFLKIAFLKSFIFF